MEMIHSTLLKHSIHFHFYECVWMHHLISAYINKLDRLHKKGPSAYIINFQYTQKKSNTCVVIKNSAPKTP